MQPTTPSQDVTPNAATGKICQHSETIRTLAHTITPNDGACKRDMMVNLATILRYTAGTTSSKSDDKADFAWSHEQGSFTLAAKADQPSLQQKASTRLAVAVM